MFSYIPKTNGWNPRWILHVIMANVHTTPHTAQQVEGLQVQHRVILTYSVLRMYEERNVSLFMFECWDRIFQGTAERYARLPSKLYANSKYLNSTQSRQSDQDEKRGMSRCLKLPRLTYFNDKDLYLSLRPCAKAYDCRRGASRLLYLQVSDETVKV